LQLQDLKGEFRKIKYYSSHEARKITVGLVDFPFYVLIAQCFFLLKKNPAGAGLKKYSIFDVIV
jgi:hypothetical protein